MYAEIVANQSYYPVLKMYVIQIYIPHRVFRTHQIAQQAGHILFVSNNSQ